MKRKTSVFESAQSVTIATLMEGEAVGEDKDKDADVGIVALPPSAPPAIMIAMRKKKKRKTIQVLVPGPA